MSNTKKTLIFFFILMVTLSVQSQTPIRKVLSLETKAPISGVNIVVVGTDRGTSTDHQGIFLLSEISDLKSTDTLRFSHVGHETKRVLAKYILNLISPVFLRESPEILDEIVLNGEKGRQYKKIPFDEMSPLSSALCCFGAMVTEYGKKIVLIGGDESYEEDLIKKRLSEDPSLSNPVGSLLDIASRPTANLEWQHFSGDIYEYNLSSDAWVEIESGIGKRAYHNVLLYKDHIFVIGGKRLAKNQRSEFLANDIEILNLETDRVVVDYTNPHQAVNFGSVIYSNNAIIFGGSIKMMTNGKKKYSDKVHLYSFDSGLWYELNGLSKAKETNGTLIGNKFYTVGGFNGMPLKEIEAYDLNTEVSIKEAELFEGMERPGITSYNGIIYIMESGKLLTYNTELSILKEYTISSMVSSPFLLINKGFLFAIGGSKVTRYSRRPSNKMIRINLKDIENTSVIQSRKFK